MIKVTAKAIDFQTMPKSQRGGSAYQFLERLAEEVTVDPYKLQSKLLKLQNDRRKRLIRKAKKEDLIRLVNHLCQLHD